MIEGAALGDDELAEGFVRTYRPVVSTYFAARWRLAESDHRVADAVQQVFLDCLRKGGALERTVKSRGGGFRAFLYGIARTTALGIERSQARDRERLADLDPSTMPSREESSSHVFDRAWARMLVQEAARRLMRAHRARSTVGCDRFEVLRMRYFEGLAPREIAERLGCEAATVHQALHQARREFHSALLEAMAFREPECGREELELRCVELLQLLQ